MVRGNKYTSPIRKFSPTELSNPAYAGQHPGQASLGSSAMPIPGAADNNLCQLFIYFLR